MSNFLSVAVTRSTFGSVGLLLCVASLVVPGAQSQQNDAAANNFLEAKAKAEKGDAEGQVGLGMCYQFGMGVAKDDTEAVKWFRKAAEQNFAPGQWSLGGCYLSGRGVAKDDTEGVKWHRLAAEQNLPMSQSELGSAYLNGIGVARDDTEATKWFRKAAEQNDARAQFCLGGCYHQGRGVAKDYVEAYAWWNLAATSTRPDRVAVRNRDGLEKEMSPQQVAEGKKRTEELRAQIVTRSQERKAVRSSVPRPTPTAEAIRKSPQQVPASQPMPQPAVSAHKGRATVELTGVIGLGTPRAFLEITDQGGSGSIKKVTVKAGDRVDSIEIVQIDVKTGQVTIRNAGAESVLSFKGR